MINELKKQNNTKEMLFMNWLTTKQNKNKTRICKNELILISWGIHKKYLQP